MSKQYDPVALRAYYDTTAEERDQMPVAPWKLELREQFIQMLRAESKTRVLELGAGPGRDSKALQEAGFDVVATDLSPEMVARCRAKGLDARVLDYRYLDLPPAAFGGVYALNSLLHTPKAELDEVLAGIAGVLEPGGLFFMGVYGGFEFEGLRQDHRHKDRRRYFSYYADVALLRRLEQHFKVLSFQTIDVGLSDLRAQACFLRKP